MEQAQRSWWGIWRALEISKLFLLPYLVSPKIGCPMEERWARIWWGRPVMSRTSSREQIFPAFSMVEILLYLVSIGTALSFCSVMIVTWFADSFFWGSLSGCPVLLFLLRRCSGSIYEGYGSWWFHSAFADLWQFFRKERYRLYFCPDGCIRMASLWNDYCNGNSPAERHSVIIHWSYHFGSVCLPVCLRWGYAHLRNDASWKGEGRFLLWGICVFLFRECMECFIGKPYFYVVFFPENFFSRAFFIVPCDIFLAEAFVEQACRSLGQEFAKVLEKRLSFFCFGDGKFFHGKLLYREKFFEIF